MQTYRSHSAPLDASPLRGPAHEKPVNKFTGHTARVWTSARDDELIALYTSEPKRSYPDIAAAMGLRASQVHGRLDRLRAAGVLAPRPREATAVRKPAPPATGDELRTALQPYASDTWPVDKLVRLCLGWIAGEKTVALADRLQVSKNAAVGKVHRLVAWGLLGARPSPLLGAPLTPEQRDERRQARVPVATLPPLPSASESVAESRAPDPRPDSPPSIESISPIPIVAEPRSLACTASPTYRRECCWPIGEPGRPGFRFCADPTGGTLIYCPEHHQIAYTRFPVRQAA